MKKYIYILSFALFIITGTNQVEAQRITVTIAGTGMPGYSGDGGPAKLAKLSGCQFICSDPSGNVYFVDAGKVRKVSLKNGIVTIFAGGGISISDGIPATNSSLSFGNLCTDPAGNIYLLSGEKIMIVNAVTNIINTFAGTGAMGYSGDGGPATAAVFNNITAICSDQSGNIYVVDRANYRIRKITAGTGIVTTIAGNGSPGYSGDGGPATSATINWPIYIGCNSAGDIYFLDQYSTYIRKVTASTGYISTYAGGGGIITDCPALSTNLSSPSGLCVNAYDNVCFNELSCSCREISHITDSTHYIGGNYSTESYKDDTNSLYAWMDTQWGVTSDAKNNIYIADNGNSRIRKLIQLTHTPTFAYGKGQTITPCPGYIYIFDSLMAITDLDSAQTETWTVISPPVIGTLSGFPSSSISNGTHKTVKSSGLSYLAPSTYTGQDSFRVRVSDGTLSDTITIYVVVQTTTPGTISGAASVCVGSTATLTDTCIFPGTWSTSNSNVIVGSSSGIITGHIAGVDTITFTLAGTCPLSTYKVITIHPALIINSISGADSLCRGTTITLTDSLPGGTWSSVIPSVASVDSITGMVYGRYDSSVTIKYTASNSWCTSEISKTITVYSPYTGIITGPVIVCVSATITLSNTTLGGIWSVSNANAAIGVSGTVTGVMSGTDSVKYTVTSISGCSATISSLVTITTGILPDDGTIVGSANVCPYSSITLTDASGGGIWSITNPKATISGTGIVTGTIPGLDTVLYAVTNGCGTLTATRVITVKAFPDPGTITGLDSVCKGESITLTDTTSGGSWGQANRNAVVSASGIVTGMEQGIDTIVYFVTNDCGTSDVSRQIIVKDCHLVDINNIVSVPAINIFPNPASSILNIEWTSLQAGNADIIVTNVTGQVVAKNELINNNGSGSMQLNISDLKEGVYLLSITSGSDHFTDKLVINK